MASAYRTGTNEIRQPVQEDIIALLNHHGLVGDDAARALMLCSALIDAALCVCYGPTARPAAGSLPVRLYLRTPPILSSPRVLSPDPVTTP
eukprot:3764521-Prymnesium_polylepis.1